MNLRSDQGNERLAGVLFAAGAYLLWGVLPIYWKQLSQVPAYEILAHRVVWSCLFMFCILLATRGLRQFFKEMLDICRNRKKLLGLVIASLLISVNWLIYIWAVNENRVVETSLGYYINPLVSVLLGIVVLKERFSMWQSVSFALAAIGVITMTVSFGTIPWVSLSLAISFAFYGMCKKILGIGAVTATTLETLIVSPVAVAYLLYLAGQGVGTFSLSALPTSGLLMGAGAMTATPLLLFASGANRLPLSLMGFIQYVSPTIALAIGVLLYHEPFTTVHLISFSLIWLALGVFSLARTRIFVSAEEWIAKASS
ncbi:EamA family transporter RarD [Sporomusa malonica]|uniref:Chloramphenicol-sensitive protein RarD n=1 Tax=Sporomusa malonica TaxID=112901 RepID=A0A1W2C2Q6_9FIRM|nr:EamA family transporter RarD [Sporomusa malonica]SMC79304.1 chloramphenicol-sensitive protein RarD [Sporomusa malonica]